jgi:hypothetical protein
MSDNLLKRIQDRLLFDHKVSSREPGPGRLISNSIHPSLFPNRTPTHR